MKFINWERKGNFKAKQSVALTSLIMKPANADKFKLNLYSVTGACI